nr:MAG TPA: hypothetical protein [Bacteriophage sp.]
MYPAFTYERRVLRCMPNSSQVSDIVYRAVGFIFG